MLTLFTCVLNIYLPDFSKTCETIYILKYSSIHVNTNIPNITPSVVRFIFIFSALIPENIVPIDNTDTIMQINGNKLNVSNRLISLFSNILPSTIACVAI